MKREFKPLCINIIPNWYQILIDNKLDSNFKKDVLNDIKNHRIETSDIWKGEINFTILESNSKKGTQLIFNDDYKYFSSSVDFQTIKYSFFPKFWIKESLDGYDIGITLENLTESNGDENITLTCLPYGLFNLPLFKFGLVSEKELTNLLNKNNWEKIDIDYQGFFADQDGGVENKYLTVYWKEI